jgi:hypothetical protein
MFKKLVDRAVDTAVGIRDAATGLVSAEVDQLINELSENGRRVGRVAILVVALIAVVFWGFAVLLFAAVAGLAVVVPVWAAALIVGGAMLLIAAILGLVVQRRWNEVENPADTVRRRVADHVQWWEEEMAALSPERELEERSRAVEEESW